MPDPIKLRIEGDELVELKRHADDFSECPGLPRRIQKYRGVKPFILPLEELGWMVAMLNAILKDPKGYPLVTLNPWNLEYVSKKDPRCKTCKALYQRLKQEADRITEANLRWWKKYQTRKSIEISRGQFDKISDYLFEGSFPKHMKPFRRKDKTTCRISITLEELKDLISSLNYYADLSGNKSIAKRLRQLAMELKPCTANFE
jgi:hypothetical protein